MDNEWDSAADGWPGDVRAEWAALARAPGFARSPVMRRLLWFLIDEAVAGRGSQIKAYTIAVDALGRAPDFDAQHDSYPRVQMGRLRRILDRHYRDHMPAGVLRFDLQPGSYQLIFAQAEAIAAPLPSADAAAAAQRPDPAKDAAVNAPPPGDPPSFPPMVDAPPADPVVKAGAGRHMKWWPWALAMLAVLAVAAWQLVPLVRSSAAEQVQPLPLMEIATVAAYPATAENRETAGFVTAQLVDMAQRSGWVDVSAGDMADAALSSPASPDFRLNSRLDDRGDDFRLSAELVAPRSNKVIWSGTFTLGRRPDGSVAGFRQVLTAIATRLIDTGGAIPSQQLRISSDGPPSPGYACLVHAQTVRQSRLQPDAAVRACLERTVSLDPRSANAWALLALLTLDQWQIGEGKPAALAARAVRIARHAVRLDPYNGYVMSALAHVEFRTGQTARALVDARHAVDLNDYSGALLARMGADMFYMGDKAGLDLVRRALDSDPDPPIWARAPLFYDALMRGDASEAIAEAARLPDGRIGPDSFSTAVRAIAAALAGRTAEARALWRHVEAADARSIADPGHVFDRMGLPAAIRQRALSVLAGAGVIGAAMRHQP